jgi:hypothetical protein
MQTSVQVAIWGKRVSKVQSIIGTEEFVVIGMKTAKMAALLGIVALLGNVMVDWVTHTKPAPIELVGAAIVGMILSLGFRTEKSK